MTASGGRIGFETVAWFNGGLFDDGAALPLERSDIETVLAASTLDRSEVDPSILGTLFKRGLGPGKRALHGREKILQLVEPVVVGPLFAEWERGKAAIAAELERAEAPRSGAARMKRRNDAERRYRAFLTRLREFTVRDPACGSGNFLCLALQALKDLEHRVQLETESLGFQGAFPEVGPANVEGIELNPYAADLACVSVWIGEIQWMRRNGFAEARNPVLKPLDTIECRDAILTPDNLEPKWPAADVVIGNPPFLGGKLLITHLGENYIDGDKLIDLLIEHGIPRPQAHPPWCWPSIRMRAPTWTEPHNHGRRACTGDTLLGVEGLRTVARPRCRG